MYFIVNFSLSFLRNLPADVDYDVMLVFIGKSKNELTNSPSKSAIRTPDTPTKPHPPIKTVSWASDSVEEGEELTGSQLRRRLEEFSTDNVS